MEHEYVYRVNATSTTLRSGTLSADEIEPSIAFSAPPEFYGQGGQWTPEHLLVASVAGCFISTFSGMADYSKLDFICLSLEAEGVIEKEEGGWCFKRVVLRPRLKIAQEKDRERANRLLQKAEKTCLITRSLACATVLEPELEVEEELLESKTMGNSIPIS